VDAAQERQNPRHESSWARLGQAQSTDYIQQHTESQLRVDQLQRRYCRPPEPPPELLPRDPIFRPPVLVPEPEPRFFCLYCCGCRLSWSCRRRRKRIQGRRRAQRTEPAPPFLCFMLLAKLLKEKVRACTSKCVGWELGLDQMCGVGISDSGCAAY
jgi:hypothetical protein